MLEEAVSIDESTPLGAMTRAYHDCFWRGQTWVTTTELKRATDILESLETLGFELTKK